MFWEEHWASSRACGSREIVCSANDQTCRHDDHTFSLYQMLHPFVLLFVPLSYLCHCLPWVVDLFLLLLVNIQSCISIHAVFLFRQFSPHHAVFWFYIILGEIFAYKINLFHDLSSWLLCWLDWLVGCVLIFCWLICFFLHSFSPSAVVCYNSISVELFRKLFFGCLQLSAWGLFTDIWDSQSLQHFLKQNLIISSSNGWFQFFLYFNACSDIRQQLNYLKN